jgi:hypothetical protein
MRRLLEGALQREKPRAPPAGGRRGQVELLAHAYADSTRDRRSILTIMFVRDSCSKQLDSDRRFSTARFAGDGRGGT